MIIAYFLIAAFVLGGYVGAIVQSGERLPRQDWALIPILSALWPLLIPLYLYEKAKEERP